MSQLPVWAYIVLGVAAIVATLLSSIIGSWLASKFNGTAIAKQVEMQTATKIATLEASVVTWPKHNDSMQRVHVRVDEIKKCVASIDKSTGIITEKVKAMSQVCEMRRLDFDRLHDRVHKLES